MADTSTQTGKDLDFARFAAAKSQRDRWTHILDEAYQYCLPQYAPPSQSASGGEAKGEKRGANVFDTTAEDALTEKAARTQDQLFPPFSEWMDFAPAEPVELSDENKKALQERFADARMKFHNAVEVSNFHIEMPLSLREGYISTGAVTVDMGTPANPLVFGALPVGQLIPEESPDGVIRTNFREQKVKYRDLKVKWPKAEIPADVEQKISASPDTDITVYEMEIYDPETEDTRYRVFVGALKADRQIHDEKFGAQRTICFRLDKVPGETMGRGPALAKLPDIKTANKCVELILKNASIAVTGIWQADDDGVLNPANIKLVPGTIIPKAVGSEGLRPLEAPGKFDISQLVLADIQDRIERAIKGPSLPPADDAVRTAFELGERRADQRAVEVPQTLRLLNELYFPLAKRILHILTHPSMSGSPYYIGDIEIAGEKVVPRPISPLVRLRDQAEAELALSALAAVAQFDPEGIREIVDMPATERWFLENHSFPAKLMRDADTVAKERRENALVEGAAQAGAEAVARAEQEAS